MRIPNKTPEYPTPTSKVTACNNECYKVKSLLDKVLELQNSDPCEGCPFVCDPSCPHFKD